jgi:hypothetical protein
MNLLNVKKLCVVVLAAAALAPPATPIKAVCGSAARPDGKYRVYISPEALVRTSGMLLGTYDRLSDAIAAARQARRARGVPVVIASGTAADQHWLHANDEGRADFYELYTITRRGWMCRGSYFTPDDAAAAAGKLLEQGAAEIVAQYGPK